MLGRINFFGILFTSLVPESKGKSQEELTGEKEEESELAVEHQASSTGVVPV
jgi:PHS family inorganic phosphate transporter-like MFS transporter